jgi:hypothetical protein
MSVRFLHVANGTCTTRLIEAAGIPGERSLWADPLHDGPVPGGLTDDELLETRRRHLGGADDAALDPVNDLRRWRAVVAQHEAYDELVLWFEHDVFDQLNLIQVLDWIRRHVPMQKPVSLVSLGAFPGHPAFKGLGELSPGDMPALLDGRWPVSDRQFKLATEAWRAFREPTPQPLDALRRQQQHTAALPFLPRAVTRLLQELPWTGDGLSRTERRLLQVAAGGPTTPSAALSRMHQGEDAYYVTDTAVADLAAELSQTLPPLLHADGSLAEAGRAVLAGQANRITLCGIDRWLGGTHVRAGNVWQWDDERQQVRL